MPGSVLGLLWLVLVLSLPTALACISVQLVCHAFGRP